MHSVHQERHSFQYANRFDRYLSPDIRKFIEREYYQKVGEQAELEVVANNPAFLENPFDHVALFSDHGPVHARNVATNILEVLHAATGVLIPRRSSVRFEFMCGYGVMVAFCHDIGMKDFSAFGRAMHPEFAAQEVFSPAWDPIIDAMWNENCGGIAWRLVTLTNCAAFCEHHKIIVREVLALSMAHSKSKIPISTLNDRAALRDVLRYTVSTELSSLHIGQQRAKQARSENASRPAGNAGVSMTPSLVTGTDAHNSPAMEDQPPVAFAQAELAHRLYSDFDQNAFAWLTSTNPEVEEFVCDVIDTLSALRVADALRQRGTTLKTSASYPILVDQSTGNAVFALSRSTGETFLLESAKQISAGEANIASTELTHQGDLRVSFHRGAFSNEDAAERSADNVAAIIDDIQRDVVGAFLRPAAHVGELKATAEIKVLIEGTDDSLTFADLVLARLGRIDAALAERSRVVPSLKNVDPRERERYLEATALNWTTERQRSCLTRIAQAGHRTTLVDLKVAFIDVRLTSVREGEVLLSAGDPPGFVYIAIGDGLRATPLGGYKSFAVRPWTPVGNIRAIRGAPQEATVTADQDLQVLIIPREVYLKFWHYTYSESQFFALLTTLTEDDDRQRAERAFDIIGQVAMLDANLDQRELDFIVRFVSAHGLELSAATLRADLERRGKTDVLQLRENVRAYLASKPHVTQIAHLKDMLNTVAKLDETMEKDEVLALTELNGLFDEALSQGETLPRYTVFIAPQSSQQDLAISSLFPDFIRQDTAGGSGFAAGSFYSAEYAEVVCGRYRDLSFLTVVIDDGKEPGEVTAVA